MKLFIDTANIEEIKEISQWGILEGVTTNPSLIAKEGKDFKTVVAEIAKLVDGPISAEVNSYKSDEMIEEARALSKIHKNVIIKLPMTEEGLKAISVLSKEDIKTNCTLIFSTGQAMLAASAGATYVSPFIGRIDDIGYDGVQLISDIAEIYAIHGIDTMIISASIRTVNHVKEAALAGSDIATIPYKILKAMAKHPLTDKGIAAFQADWEKHRNEMNK